MQKYLKILGVRQTLTSTPHPRMNSIVERCNQTLGTDPHQSVTRRGSKMGLIPPQSAIYYAGPCAPGYKIYTVRVAMRWQTPLAHVNAQALYFSDRTRTCAKNRIHVEEH